MKFSKMMIYICMCVVLVNCGSGSSSSSSGQDIIRSQNLESDALVTTKWCDFFHNEQKTFVASMLTFKGDGTYEYRESDESSFSSTNSFNGTWKSENNQLSIANPVAISSGWTSRFAIYKSTAANPTYFDGERLTLALYDVQVPGPKLYYSCK